jgi:hypothetical protein
MKSQIFFEKKKKRWGGNKSTKKTKKELIKNNSAEHWCLMPLILPSQEAETRRIAVLSQPGQIFLTCRL